MSLAIGAIADDLTGATDLASALVERGLRTTISIGAAPVDLTSQDAAVVALKSRSIPANDATALSLDALALLGDARRVFFKYCSTFDSTPAGNIGPVSDALLDAIGQPLLLHCPTFPATGRTVVDAQLLVHGVPLSSTAMRHHPVNPMTESDLVKVLGEQVTAKVGSIPLATVREGPAAVSALAGQLARDGVRHVIVDAVNDDDLMIAAQGAQDMRLTAGATGLGAAIGADPSRGSAPAEFDDPGGSTVVLVGSCSETTLRQLNTASATCPVFRIDVGAMMDGDDPVPTAVDWAMTRLRSANTVVIAASADVGDRFEREGADAGARIEATMGRLASALVKTAGIRRILVAGGETSGAVTAALDITGLTVGPQIDPGVPVVLTRTSDPLALILKSGNFGRDDLFVDPFGRRLWLA